MPNAALKDSQSRRISHLRNRGRLSALRAALVTSQKGVNIMARKYNSSRYPSAKKIMEGVDIPCTKIKDLDQNGLRDWTIRVKFIWTEDKEDDVWVPDLKWMILKPGGKRRMLLGTDLGGFTKLTRLPNADAVAAFMRYTSALEEVKMPAIGTIVQKAWDAEDKLDKRIESGQELDDDC